MKDEIQRLRRQLAKANTKISRLENKNKTLEAKIEKLMNKKSTPSKKLRNSKEYKEFRKMMFKRDENKCTVCGSTNRLQLHHIKEVCNYPELAMNSDNVTTLCAACHLNTDNYLKRR